jgi:hypothetical protein
MSGAIPLLPLYAFMAWAGISRLALFVLVPNIRSGKKIHFELNGNTHFRNVNCFYCFGFLTLWVGGGLNAWNVWNDESER